MKLEYDHEPAEELLLPISGHNSGEGLLHRIHRHEEVVFCEWRDGSWWHMNNLGVRYRMSPYEMAMNGWKIGIPPTAKAEIEPKEKPKPELSVSDLKLELSNFKTFFMYFCNIREDKLFGKTVEEHVEFLNGLAKDLRLTYEKR